MARTSAVVVAWAAVLMPSPSSWGCSPAGHSFVAIAAIGKLSQSEDPAVRRLAARLRTYRWVVYWGAEGPDTVQDGRGYRFSHLMPLFQIDYEHPERFDLEAAKPVFRAMLDGAWRVDYAVSAADTAAHGLRLVRPPRPDWRDVSLAFAAGYVTHLLSDYFCHHPAKVWWDLDAELPPAVKAGVDSTSYGTVQEILAVMLWSRFLADYGVPDDAAADFASRLADYHVDNGVLPYCALACSKDSYARWPAAVEELVDPSKYDHCAAPMIGGGGEGLGRAVERETARVAKILAARGLSLDEAIRYSEERTHWRETYAEVIDMIVAVWTDAAHHLELPEPTAEDVVAAALSAPQPVGGLIDLAGEAGPVANLALYRDWSVRRYHLRNGDEGPVTVWGQAPSGGRFDLHVLVDQGRGQLALATEGPYLLGPGYVSATFRLRLPPGRQVRFESAVRMFNNPQGSDGVTFRIELTDAGGTLHRLFEQHVDRQQPVPVTLDLTPFAGGEVGLSLISDCGPKNNLMRDWGAWVEPRVQVVD